MNFAFHCCIAISLLNWILKSHYRFGKCYGIKSKENEKENFYENSTLSWATAIILHEKWTRISAHLHAIIYVSFFDVFFINISVYQCISVSAYHLFMPHSNFNQFYLGGVHVIVWLSQFFFRFLYAKRVYFAHDIIIGRCAYHCDAKNDIVCGSFFSDLVFGTHIRSMNRRVRERFVNVVACKSRFYSPGLLIDLKRSSRRDNFFKWNIIHSCMNDIIGETFLMTSSIGRCYCCWWWWWCAHHSD